VTTEGAAPTVSAAEDDEPAALRCYRHPDRETYVRCGRCDQPICSRCAMQGPVGFRCRQCGRPKNDPLTSMRPSQLAIGLGVAALGGVVVGLLTGFGGIFGLLIAWFAGGIIADAVIRFVGFKRGPRMMATLFGGIVIGALVGFIVQAGSFVAGLGPDEGAFIGGFLLNQGLWAAVGVAVACFGAWSRLRF
jgi:hypothetical protein